jgi:sulfopyruvate decarboxylase subunit alpha
MIDRNLVDSIYNAGVDTVLSVPCNMLAGILQEIDARPFVHVPVCREEEGIGIAAGAALAGKHPMILMQNSGLGNSINAIMSLTHYYRIPLFMLMSHRGGPGEPIAAQVPMGHAVIPLLDALSIETMVVSRPEMINDLEQFIKGAYDLSRIRSALLPLELWHEAA